MPDCLRSSRARLGAVVLAAGASRRMGSCKALLPLGNHPLIALVVRNCLNSRVLESIVVVTGHQPQLVEHALAEYDVTLLHNADFDRGGMISSIKAGLRALPRDIDAAFIVLGDQPLIRPGTFAALAREFDGRILRPTHHKRHGHPILIPARFVPAILALPPDATLKQFIDERMPECVDVPVEDPGILMDVDTPDDYQRAVEVATQASQLQVRSDSCEGLELMRVAAG